MATLSELQARREALLKAIQSGALIVRQGDSSVQYRDMKEMLEALATIDASISAVDGTTRVRTLRIIPKDSW